MTPGEVSFFRGALNGFKRLVASAKIQASVGGLTASWVALHYEAAGLPPTQRVAAIIAFQAAVFGVLREVVAAWSAEDVAKVQASQPAVPAVPAVQSAAGDIVNEQPQGQPPPPDATPPAGAAVPANPKPPTRPTADAATFGATGWTVAGGTTPAPGGWRLSEQAKAKL